MYICLFIMKIFKRLMSLVIYFVERLGIFKDEVNGFNYFVVFVVVMFYIVIECVLRFVEVIIVECSVVVCDVKCYCLYVYCF